MYNKASHGAYSVYQLIHLGLNCYLMKMQKANVEAVCAQ